MSERLCDQDRERLVRLVHHVAAGRALGYLGAEDRAWIDSVRAGVCSALSGSVSHSPDGEAGEVESAGAVDVAAGVLDLLAPGWRDESSTTDPGPVLVSIASGRVPVRDAARVLVAEHRLVDSVARRVDELAEHLATGAVLDAAPAKLRTWVANERARGSSGRRPRVAPVLDVLAPGWDRPRSRRHEAAVRVGEVAAVRIVQLAEHVVVAAQAGHPVEGGVLPDGVPAEVRLWVDTARSAAHRATLVSAQQEFLDRIVPGWRGSQAPVRWREDAQTIQRVLDLRGQGYTLERIAGEVGYPMHWVSEVVRREAVARDHPDAVGFTGGSRFRADGLGRVDGQRLDALTAALAAGIPLREIDADLRQWLARTRTRAASQASHTLLVKRLDEVAPGWRDPDLTSRTTGRARAAASTAVPGSPVGGADRAQLARLVRHVAAGCALDALPAELLVWVVDQQPHSRAADPGSGDSCTGDHACDAGADAGGQVDVGGGRDRACVGVLDLIAPGWRDLTRASRPAPVILDVGAGPLPVREAVEEAIARLGVRQLTAQRLRDLGEHVEAGGTIYSLTGSQRGWLDKRREYARAGRHCAYAPVLDALVPGWDTVLRPARGHLGAVAAGHVVDLAVHVADTQTGGQTGAPGDDARIARDLPSGLRTWLRLRQDGAQPDADTGTTRMLDQVWPAWRHTDLRVRATRPRADK